VTISSSAFEACRNSEAVVIATEWKEFRDIDWELVYQGMNKPAFVFDGRLIIDAEKLKKIGFKVTTIGRGERV
jgi:UDPglucose 6-dehydrogenase